MSYLAVCRLPKEVRSYITTTASDSSTCLSHYYFTIGRTASRISARLDNDEFTCIPEVHSEGSGPHFDLCRVELDGNSRYNFAGIRAVGESSQRGGFANGDISNDKNCINLNLLLRISSI